ncbi:Cytochrome c heme lyase subunit CcmL [hydrothermal vent metagenome]|uniref:Cytochrome c heme lyase subunit CcmL n=1 Tax=hydrothermal vent metagenome TaxID=652676 RepID=A0A3B0RRC2_9ZZZZ
MGRSLISAALALILAVAFVAPALAVDPDEVLDDAVLEQRARDLSRQLRCVVCQSQNIDNSNAPLAKDMRLLVRERLVAGDSDEVIIAYLVARYGDYILLKPPVQTNTAFLWAAPMLIFAFAAAIAGFYLARMRRADNDAADER